MAKNEYGEKLDSNGYAPSILSKSPTCLIWGGIAPPGTKSFSDRTGIRASGLACGQTSVLGATRTA